MTNRSLIVHGHFYQPPREDPLTGVIPLETGASPFRNWNERIHAECYRPNAELRNFEKVSFNVGPTLLAWMFAHDPLTAAKIVEQDRANVRRYGVGNAIAQSYNHTILPLASYQDKVTQVAWGIADFEHRFHRRPQGMWLPETAADSETLEVLAAQGIEFTILAPWQSREPDLDVTEPYLYPLPAGRSITIFFYQKELSSQVSFDAGATINADSFAEYLLRPYFNQEKERRGEPQMLMIASDGELYGHHQYLRDRFLARLVDGASSRLDINPTFPAQWLQRYPVRRTINIHEKTSWSCHHGVARWMGKCGCTSGDGGWKAQLRYAFERLAGELDRAYLDAVKPFVADPWGLRNEYIHVILGKVRVDEIVQRMVGCSLTTARLQQTHLLLEAQRERQRMFTSCGWFFDDCDRIEPRNNLAYAAQAVRLLRMATGVDLEASVKADLQLVSSERSGMRADRIFERFMRRAEGVNGVRIGAVK
jgi:alpha-amylase/alpha-mannosidase (GH57 family)